MALRGKKPKKHARKAVSPQQRALNDQTMHMAVQVHGAGNLAKAQDLYSQVLASDPRHPDALHLLGLCAYQQGDLNTAVDLMRRSIAINDGNPDSLYNLAKVYQDMGKPKEAVATYQKALKLRPDADTHFNLANVYRAHNNWSQAAEHYRAATELNPAYIEAHVCLGLMLQELVDMDGALTSFQAALAINPAQAEAHFCRADILDKTNRITELDDAVQEALQACPDDPKCIMAEAMALIRRKDFATARDRLEGIDDAHLTSMLQQRRRYMLGGVYERLGDSPSAFAHFKAANDLARTRLPQQGVDPKRFVDLLEAHADCFTADWVDQWQPIEPLEGRSDPVFMVGFPRSGTTLLDTILRGHPEITVVEEAEATARTYGDLKLRSRNDLSTLKRAKRAQAFRTSYFANMDLHPDGAKAAEGMLLIDKLALHAVYAGTLNRAFPDAKFILVQRHPYDCVLSCFMQDFTPNDAMSNFLDLQDAARLYDQTFALWTQYTELLDFDVHTVRYEDLVVDMEGQIKPLLSFVGLDWHDGVRDYAKTAKARKHIDTPSYIQVTEKLYTRASGRWKKYRDELAPVIDILAPWAERFGYET